MILLKLTGGAMLMLAAAELGNRLCAREKLRLERIAGYCALLKHITSQIETYNLPIADIIRECDADLLSHCGLDGTAADFGAVLAGGREWLDGASVRALEAVAEQLKHGYRRPLLDALGGCMSVLDGALKTESARIENRCHVIRVLCLCGGALVAVLLL